MKNDEEIQHLYKQGKEAKTKCGEDLNKVSWVMLEELVTCKKCKEK